jgi:hypothetical protein
MTPLSVSVCVYHPLNFLISKPILIKLNMYIIALELVITEYVKKIPDIINTNITTSQFAEAKLLYVLFENLYQSSRTCWVNHAS